tara:strand:- start:737 stop:1030 length:294 start_codon:yes stop_codon:yes gene_type:complete
MGILTEDDIFNMILEESYVIDMAERAETNAIDKLIRELKEECDYLDSLLENIKEMWMYSEIDFDMEYYEALRKYRKKELLEKEDMKRDILKKFRKNF